MIKDAINKVRSNFDFLIEEYGILDEHKSDFLLSLEALDSLLNKKTRSKKRFPKIFRIVKGKDHDVMEEQIVGVEDGLIFCVRSMHDTIVQAAIKMQSEGKDFNRFTLLEAAQALNNRVSTPAILVCLHYWMSIEDPLLYKKDGSDLFALSCGPENFLDDADRAWDELVEGELRVEAPRGCL